MDDVPMSRCKRKSININGLQSGHNRDTRQEMSRCPDAKGHRDNRDTIHPPTNGERLRRLARAVERIGVSGRTDPEEIVLAKLTIARELRGIARDIDR